jgi:NSS family neurotransmitter:Na+ symporter
LDLARVSLASALEAIGLGFFSIGVDFGVMVTNAGYAGREIDLREVALVTIVGDTAVSLMAGFAVFRVAFAAGLDPASGPGLMFITMPAAFAQLPYGGAWTLAFYLLLFVAALASAISLGRVARPAGVIAAPVGDDGRGRRLLALGIVTVLSYRVPRDWFPLSFVPRFEEAGFYEVIDHLTSNVMLPAAGLLLAVFTGSLLLEAVLRDELALSGSRARLLRVVVGPAP